MLVEFTEGLYERILSFGLGMIDLTGVLSSIEAAFGPSSALRPCSMPRPYFQQGPLPTPLRVLLAASVSSWWFLFCRRWLLLSPCPLRAFSAWRRRFYSSVMGFAIAMAFSVLTQAGENIALGMGLGFASINDPNNGLSVPIVSQFYGIVGTLLFLVLGAMGW